ncbi:MULTISPECIES: FtsX-like permease family protein [unclassified Methanoregula]|uniref:ABC transporter permease n=1 Tax=unclassified Methanoregula TaxID=2649730 RepID=UPI0009C785A8|nr:MULTISPECIES: FtsX-like permease family protein [unclassified Methanoregula]OPX64154.1 MAG: FtsX-like permease family protein [Methanoregula sp. PtaB.Bin085]OPY34726.1 MAG: FtsX-like permease family protein [Methanoregula sp. PtaU1.Bin006]
MNETVIRLKLSFFLGLRSLRRGSIGSLVMTVVIIGMVFTNMIFLPSVITGAINLFVEQTIEYQSGDVLIQPKEDVEVISDLEDLLARVNRAPGVLRAAPHNNIGGVMKFKGSRLAGSVIAIRPRDEVLVTGVSGKIRDGEYLGEGDTGVIIIGNYVAGHKDKSEDLMPSLGGVRAGDSIDVEFTNGVVRTYRVKGVFETKSYMADQSVFITWEELESIRGQKVDEATEVLVRTVPGEDAEEVKLSLTGMGIQEQIKTWHDLLGKAFAQVVQSYGVINSISTIVSIVIAIVVIFIVIMIKTLNNRRQIGILKAIGIHRTTITYSYVFQVILLAIMGIFFGMLILFAMDRYFAVYPIRFPDGDIRPAFTLADIVTNAILLFVSSAIAGFIPAWLIAREEILTAMRG